MLFLVYAKVQQKCTFSCQNQLNSEILSAVVATCITSTLYLTQVYFTIEKTPATECVYVCYKVLIKEVVEESYCN